VLLGCGGSGGFNSQVDLRLERVSGADMRDVRLTISPNDGSALDANAASDVQSPPWLDAFFRDASSKRAQWTTTSGLVPYLVYTENVAGSSVTVRLIIVVDGNEQLRTNPFIPGPSPEQRARIFRNNVER
jgi:hypothetical protein